MKYNRGRCNIDLVVVDKSFSKSLYYQAKAINVWNVQ